MFAEYVTSPSRFAPTLSGNEEGLLFRPRHRTNFQPMSRVGLEPTTYGLKVR